MQCKPLFADSSIAKRVVQSFVCQHRTCVNVSLIEYENVTLQLSVCGVQVSAVMSVVHVFVIVCYYIITLVYFQINNFLLPEFYSSFLFCHDTLHSSPHPVSPFLCAAHKATQLVQVMNSTKEKERKKEKRRLITIVTFSPLHIPYMSLINKTSSTVRNK